MAKTYHLGTKFTLASYELLIQCDDAELRFYCYVKLYAINKSSAFPSMRTIKGELGWSNNKIVGTIKRMEEKKRLAIKRKDGKNNVYDISWYDRLNERRCSQGEKTNVLTVRTPMFSRREQNEKKENEKKKTKPATKVAFSLKEYLETMRTDKQRAIQVIGLYIGLKGLAPENCDQMKSIIKRNLRAAQRLVGYKNDDIKETIRAMRNTEYLSKWTLETVEKFIDEIVAENAKRGPKGPKILRWEHVKQEENGQTYDVAVPIYEKSEKKQ